MNLMLYAMNKRRLSAYLVRLRVTQSKALAQFVHSKKFFLSLLRDAKIAQTTRKNKIKVIQT